MDSSFFEQPILNSPYEYPGRHWELDDDGPADRADHRAPPARRVHHADPEAEEAQAAEAGQKELVFDEGAGSRPKSSSTTRPPIINELRQHVDALARACRTRTTGR